MPEKVRVVLSSCSQEGADAERAYSSVEALVLVNVVGAKEKAKGCEMRATGGNCAFIGKAIVGIAPMRLKRQSIKRSAAKRLMAA